MDSIALKNKELKSQGKKILFNVIQYIKKMKMSLAVSEGM
jgi:hypothetical protein